MSGAGSPIVECRGRASRSWRAVVIMLAAALAACTGTFNPGDLLSAGQPAPPGAPGNGPPQPGAPAPLPAGGVRVGLILPLSAGGNAGAAGQAMRRAAEMALAEFNASNIQLLTKDDAGTAAGAETAARQAIDEGAEIIIGPLFANAVTNVRQVARGRGVPVIAFSNDTSAAAPGVYLLSFLPQTDVDRVIDYAISEGKRSFLGFVPTNGYGSVVEGAFRRAVARRGGRVMAVERYAESRGKIEEAARLLAPAASGAEALFMPDSGEPLGDAAAAFAAAGINLSQYALLGSQLWEDPKIFANPALDGGWYPGPDPEGFRAFAERYRARNGGADPPRPAALAYDAVALVAALVKTQPPRQRFASETLTNPSGFSGIGGVFRFRRDGTNERGLAILQVTPVGGQVIAPAPRGFGPSGI